MKGISLCSDCQDESIDMHIELIRSITDLEVTYQLICILGRVANRSVPSAHEFIVLIMCENKMASVVFHLTQPPSGAEGKMSQLTPIMKPKIFFFSPDIKNITNRRVLMREFQIWSQNSNRKTFTPLFGQKTVKILRNRGKSGKYQDFNSFFLAKKWVKSFPI